MKGRNSGRGSTAGLKPNVKIIISHFIWDTEPLNQWTSSAEEGSPVLIKLFQLFFSWYVKLTVSKTGKTILLS